MTKNSCLVLVLTITKGCFVYNWILKIFTIHSYPITTYSICRINTTYRWGWITTYNIKAYYICFLLAFYYFYLRIYISSYTTKIIWNFYYYPIVFPIISRTNAWKFKISIKPIVAVSIFKYYSTRSFFVSKSRSIYCNI